MLGASAWSGREGAGGNCSPSSAPALLCDLHKFVTLLLPALLPSATEQNTPVSSAGSANAHPGGFRNVT